MAKYDPSATQDWLVCDTCGTQFPTSDRNAVTTCFICDDPRQYTPPSGQSFTSLAALREAGHRNIFQPLRRPADTDSPSGNGTGSGTGSGGSDPLSNIEMITIRTDPQFAIGQRAILVRTPTGNILWDCLTFLDDETISRINGLGGLHAIAISHPHFYGSHAAEWSAAFGRCPVYLAAEDRRWTALDSDVQVFLGSDPADPGPAHEIQIAGRASGFTAIRLGGHFPGSMVGLYAGRLLVSDTLCPTPAGVGSWRADALGNPRSRPEGMNSFAFMWSIPNMIPLSADEMAHMWGVLKEYDFRSAYCAFEAMDIEAEDVKRRVLESMQIQTRRMGWVDHSLLLESV